MLTPITDSAPSRFIHRNGILLYGYYGCGNLGDDLLLSMVVQGLRPLFPGARFLVRDHGDLDGLALGGDVIFTGLETVLAGRRRGRIGRILAYFSAWWFWLGQCRWLVFGGGTLFHARGSLVSLAVQTTICLIARLRGVRIAALGVGVSDLPTPMSRRLLQAIIGLSDLFLVRDKAGLAQCRGTAADLSNDLVFAWNGVAPAAAAADKIALAVYPPVFAGESGDRVASELRDAIRELQRRGQLVVFTVFHRPGAAVGDPVIFARIADGLETPVEVRFLPLQADRLSDALADIRVMCGMRFHGLVLAAMSGRPFVGLAHDNKISDLCHRFGMPFLGLDDFQAAALVDAVIQAGHLSPDPELVRRSAEEARRNFTALAEVCGKSG